MTTFPAHQDEGILHTSFSLPATETRLTRSIPDKPFIPSDPAVDRRFDVNLMERDPQPLTELFRIALGAGGGAETGGAAMKPCAAFCSTSSPPRFLLSFCRPPFLTQSVVCVFSPCRTKKSPAYPASPLMSAGSSEHAFSGTYSRETILHWLKNFYRRFSPRGERETDPTFGPSGRQERLNCWAKNLR